MIPIEKIEGYFCPKCGIELQIIKRVGISEGSMSCANCRIVFWLDWRNFPDCLRLENLKEIFLRESATGEKATKLS